LLHDGDLFHHCVAARDSSFLQQQDRGIVPIRRSEETQRFRLARGFYAREPDVRCICDACSPAVFHWGVERQQELVFRWCCQSGYGVVVLVRDDPLERWGQLGYEDLFVQFLPQLKFCDYAYLPQSEDSYQCDFPEGCMACCQATAAIGHHLKVLTTG
jgi:hypothetical protein